MKKMLLGSIALAVVAWSGSVFAADLPVRAPVYKGAPAPIFSWTGWYVGGNVGCGWSRQDIKSFNLNDESDLSGFTGLQSDGSGCFGGAQIGGNYQFANNVVIGIEADGDWGSIKNSGSVTEEATETTTYNSRLKSFGTVRGRIGYAYDRWLPYATGGWAWGKNSISALGDVGTATSSTQTHSGWTVGGGLEWAFANNWSLKLEYLYMDLGTKNYALIFDDDGVPPGAGIKVQNQTVKLGVNYLFNGAR